MRVRILAALLVLGCQQATEPEPGPVLETDHDKAFYTLGLAVSEGLVRFALKPGELDQVILGVRDGVAGAEERVDDRMKYAVMVREIQAERAQGLAAREQTQAAEFLAARAAEPGAQKRESGIVYQELAPGSGASPDPTSQVTVHYHGTLRDGTVFDSSRLRGESAQFRLNSVIRCWTEGLQLMKVGGKSRLTCPPDTAYGARGAGSIPPGAALSFEVELLAVGD
jgi:FKBP-type peptidyl-prolyl cis-trans isomerase